VVYGDFGPNRVTVSFEIVKYELIVSNKDLDDRFLRFFVIFVIFLIVVVPWQFDRLRKTLEKGVKSIYR